MSAELDALFALLAPVTRPADPLAQTDNCRRLTPAECDRIEYGEVVEAQGDYLSLLGASIKYATEAQADPDFYAELADRYATDAEAARLEWIAKQTAYAAKHRGNGPRINSGD